jgi:SAM-dependent methyltransferase
MDRTPDPPLHELEPTTRFSDRAADYVRYRPDYPAAAIDRLLEGLRPPAGLVAADVGAGTGISARLFAERGVRVIAVEPNAEMRDAAAPHPRLEWRDGTAEATGLADASVDLVLCAQAFHWFRHRDAVAEFARILRPGGRLAIVWNRRDRTDPLTLGYVEALHAVNGEHPAERSYHFDPEVVTGAGAFTPPVRDEFPHAQTLDRAGLIGRATSASYVPKEGPAFVELVRLLDDLHARHRDGDGWVRMRYRTEVWTSARR